MGERMAELVQMKMGQGTILVEVTDKGKTVQDFSGHYQDDVERGENKVLVKIDQALDTMIQDQIVEHCKMLAGAFEQIKKQTIAPKKAHAEFGLQFNGQGNVYVAKVGAQSSFKISFDWDF